MKKDSLNKIENVIPSFENDDNKNTVVNEKIDELHHRLIHTIMDYEAEKSPTVLETLIAISELKADIIDQTIAGLWGEDGEKNYMADVELLYKQIDNFFREKDEEIDLFVVQGAFTLFLLNNERSIYEEETNNNI